ncbi:ammonium transporter [Sphingomicrobium aestuariivivum]|uniref:ammonium transporter n=1 Tax=Sphingomicrobium aestuariivivum TaxID=1582356 RepID=UPI001FD6A67B|nr:ammonium transporter [Sphingomicrobium aestuariivivum]MCJ8191301.1 ammonium transporter [Sphingomicrobium aestuariivivum]
MIDSGDTAWLLTATLLVMLMILPGLALFYGGLVRAKNLLSVMSQVMGVAALVMILWVLWGYSLAFSGEGALVGNLELAGLVGLGPEDTSGSIPTLLFAAFQMTFAAITAALIVGAVVERMRFSAILAFAALFLTFVYAPIAHMVWAEGGIILGMDAIDFAGGTVVHINAGIAGLVAVAFVGKRRGFLKDAMPPHSLALVLVGTGLLWVGWFGFNAGSALGAGGLAALAMMNTFIAPAAGVLAWMAAERLRSGKASLLGGASGAVAGLVAITPAAGISGPLGALLLGSVSALACYGFVAVAKHKLKLDDSLDVFGIHGLGGLVGSVGLVFAGLPALGGQGGYDFLPQLWVQLLSVLIAVGWSGVGSALILFAIRAVMPLRVEEEDERLGLDLAEHGERAYNS